jgi:hypothetical protein
MASEQTLLRRDPSTAMLLERAISANLDRGDLVSAADYAERIVRLRRASRWCPPLDGKLIPSVPTPAPMLSKGKLRHDIEQLTYLQERGVLSQDLAPYIERYREVRRGLGDGAFARRELNDLERDLIGDVFNRLVWRADAPRVSQALSTAWSPSRVEAAYVGHPIGIVVIDNVFTQEALESLRRFCVESTIWFENRYGYGRLGTFFRDGFNCPLLIQIAEEFQAALPRIIDGNPLVQLWAFKYEPTQPTTLPHADFAAVNVNFWLTPEQANLDDETGGLIVYDVPTPPDWDFQMYNTRGDVIADYLIRMRASSVRIPYRSNRAIVFNSRYFHKTDAVTFSPRFEDRRLNITLLFGRHQGTIRK